MLPAALVAGQNVRARQTTAAAQSGWSPIATVRDHTRDYPAGPPRPVVNPAPVYHCGVRTGVGNLLSGGNKAETVDHHEDRNGIATNTQLRPTTQMGLAADEHTFRQTGSGLPPLPAGAPAPFNSSFYGESTGMVVRRADAAGLFRSELASKIDATRYEIWIRAAEVTDGATVPSGPSGFKLGLEDANGRQSWVDVDEVGGLARPYARNPSMVKTMLNTHRFDGACFANVRDFDAGAIVAILLRLDRRDERAVAFDELQLIAK